MTTPTDDNEDEIWEPTALRGISALIAMTVLAFLVLCVLYALVMSGFQ